MIIIITIVFAFILWYVIRIMSLVVVVKKIRRVNKKDWLPIMTAFFKKRAERKLFLIFMATEAGLAGVLPQIMKANATIAYDDTKVSF